jgi:type I restriction enzyme M protein
MAKKKAEEKLNLDAILFKCRDILRQARNSGSFFEKRDMMLTLVFLRFIGEKFEDGIAKLREELIAQGLDPDDENIRAAFSMTPPLRTAPIICLWKPAGPPSSTPRHRS